MLQTSNVVQFLFFLLIPGAMFMFGAYVASILNKTPLQIILMLAWIVQAMLLAALV